VKYFQCAVIPRLPLTTDYLTTALNFLFSQKDMQD